jgi:hypothetical protein
LNAFPEFVVNHVYCIYFCTPPPRHLNLGTNWWIKKYEFTYRRMKTTYYYIIYLVHIRTPMRLFYTKIRLIHIHMLQPLYSLEIPDGAILVEYWYISWTRSTKCMSWCKCQIKEQHMLHCDNCHVQYNMLLYIQTEAS